MKTEEFFEEVEKSLKETKGRDPMGVGFFISDMDRLFNRWEEENENL